MPKELTVAGGVLALTQQEQDRLQAERGRRINQYVQGALADPAYGKLNDIGRQKVLRRAVSNATTQVDDAFANKIPADEFAQRRKQKVPQPYVA
jgi:L-aminopeptidase/D-esterase-like protein